MTEPGRLFDDVAEAYDRFRPSYPASLIDEASLMGGLGAGSRVLEIGCAIGKLPWRWPSAAWTWRRSIPPRAWWRYWVTPDASWSKTARLLRPGGLLALIWYVGGSMELDTEMLAA